MKPRDLKKALKSLIDRESNTEVLEAVRVLLEKEAPDWWEDKSAKEGGEIEEDLRQAACGELIDLDVEMKNPQNFNEHLDKKYGKEGTTERAAFHKKACYSCKLN